MGRTLLTERNFFGTLRVTLDPAGRIYSLYHGTTVHGMQFVEPQHQLEPLAYYYRAGPCGQAMNAFNRRSGMTNVAAIGLGAGAMACYAMPGQRWTFYEIDPAVIRLARESDYFTYLRRCTNAVVDFKVGDARLRLREAAPRQFDLLVCDAFGSDAPPLHLLNREAMELYLAKLSEQGVLLFHISSRYLDFQPVLANLASNFQLQALVGSEDNLSEEMLREGKLPSIWVALARRPEDLGRLETDPRWHPLAPAPAMRLWTDDYSDILGIFQWQ
jgi:SAM-dependent methyltransferase